MSTTQLRTTPLREISLSGDLGGLPRLGVVTHDGVETVAVVLTSGTSRSN
jgi:hypothetical protein